jgi:predicted methyltransferase
MNRSIPLLLLPLFLVPAAAPLGQSSLPGPAQLQAALADPRRPDAQLRQDAQRKPAAVIEFAGLKPGDRIADFMPGNAYFTRIFSDVVGPSGRVYAFVPEQQIAHCPPAEIAGTWALGRDPSYTNVAILADDVARFRVPEPLDVLWIAQNYHDLHDAFLGPADVVTLNRAFYAALKPGGVLLVIDHAAQAGSGLRDTETLHRIDPARMQDEIEAAGFVLEARSEVLRNRQDDHTLPAFDPRVRGRTDQVVLRFRKPGAAPPGGETSWSHP